MGINRSWIDRAAVALAAVGIAVGVLTPVLAHMDSGVRLAFDQATSRVYVEWVDSLSPAAQYGVESGMVVLEVNGLQLIRLPDFVYPDPPADATPDPETGEIPEPDPVIEPPVPQDLVTGERALSVIAGQPVVDLLAMRPEDLARYDPNQGAFQAFIGDDGRNSLLESLFTVTFGILVLFGAAWWLGSGRAGASLTGLSLPLALGAASPFLLAPLRHLWVAEATAAYAILLPAMMLPLAAALAMRIDDPRDRRLTMAASGVCAVAAAVALLAMQPQGFLTDLGYAIGLLMTGITLIPGVIAAGPAIPGAVPAAGGGTAGTSVEATAGGRVLQSTELAIAGLTPAAALVAAAAAPWLFLIYVGAIAAAGRFTVRPLARLASRAQLQRDLVVAATEAERARVAADIHDDALQELTLLVRRLDAAGDTEGADIARTVSDKLRAICGDLRLPILDDLGVGPALDWLVLRIERLAGGEVRLERADGSRPPADVELAFFRIAQEALANAVKHGKPPIVVRYRSTDGMASLSIDDAGTGIGPDAGERAERDGHFGLLNMQQRAEGIGAILDVRRWPAGGTHVQLEWRAR